MVFFAEGNAGARIAPARISELIDSMLQKLGKLDKVLVLPPDYTRYHSFAGEITCMLYEKLKGRSHIRIMPTLGTHGVDVDWAQGMRNEVQHFCNSSGA